MPERKAAGKDKVFYILIFLSGVLVSILTTVFFSRPEKAEARAVLYREDSGAFYSSYGYDYYFYIASSPEQRGVLYMSTVPLVVEPADNVSGMGRQYWVYAPGGNCIVRYFAGNGYSENVMTYNNCTMASGWTFRYGYPGQKYQSSHGIKTDTQTFEADTGQKFTAIISGMLVYLKDMSFDFAQYPYYVITYKPDADRYCMYFYKRKHIESDQYYLRSDCYLMYNAKNNSYSYNGGSYSLHILYAYGTGVTSTEFIFYNNFEASYSGSYLDAREFPGYRKLVGNLLPPVVSPTPEPVVRNEYGYDRLCDPPQDVHAYDVNGNGLWRFSYVPKISAKKVWCTYRIAVPSASFLKDLMLSHKTAEEATSAAAVSSWRYGSAADRQTFEIRGYCPAGDTTSGTFPLDIGSDIEKNWSELYGDISTGMLDYVKAYAYPREMVIAAWYEEYGSRAAGNVNYVEFRSLYSKSVVDGVSAMRDYEKIVSAVPDDAKTVAYYYALMTGAEKEDDVKDIAGEKTDKVSELEEKIRQLEADLEAAGKGKDSVPVWEIFVSLSEGLQSSVSGVRYIAVAIGDVLAFLPEEITGFMVFTLVALLVIAIYKALRG